VRGLTLAVGEQSEHPGMISFDGRHHHGDRVRSMRLQREAPLRRVQPRQWREYLAEPPDLHAQPHAMRFIGLPRSKGAREERFPRHVFGPRLRQRANKREQYWAAGERNHGRPGAHDVAAGVDNECVRCQQRLNLFEPKQSLSVARDQSCGGRLERVRRAVDLGHQCGNPRLARGARGLIERGSGRLRTNTPHRYASSDQAVSGPRRRRQRIGIKPLERTLGLIKLSDQKKLPGLEIPGMSGVRAVAMRFEYRPRRAERLYGPAQVTRHECDLGLGDDAARAGDGLSRTKGAGSAPQQLLGTRQLAELSHCDATQRERGRVVTQRDALQRRQRIARRQRPRRGRDQRVH